MALIEEFGFSVREGQEEALQDWLQDNEERLRQAHPPGIRYLGTYGVVFSSEKDAGQYRLLLELDNYGSIDVMSNAMKEADSEFGRLVRELNSFGSYDPRLPWSQSLYRTLVDMAVFDLNAPPATTPENGGDSS